MAGDSEGSRLTRRRRTELMSDRCILRSCGGKRQDTDFHCAILDNIRAQDPLTRGDSFVALLDLPLCSSFPPIVWWQGAAAQEHKSRMSLVSRGQTPNSAHFPLRDHDRPKAAPPRPERQQRTTVLVPRGDHCRPHRVLLARRRR